MCVCVCVCVRVKFAQSFRKLSTPPLIVIFKRATHELTQYGCGPCQKRVDTLL